MLGFRRGDPLPARHGRDEAGLISGDKSDVPKEGTRQAPAGPTPVGNAARPDTEQVPLRIPHLAPAVLALSAAVAAGLTAAPAAAAGRQRPLATSVSPPPGRPRSACFATGRNSPPGRQLAGVARAGPLLRRQQLPGRQKGSNSAATATSPSDGRCGLRQPGHALWLELGQLIHHDERVATSWATATPTGGGRFDRYTDRAANLGSWDDDISSFRLG